MKSTIVDISNGRYEVCFFNKDNIDQYKLEIKDNDEKVDLSTYAAKAFFLLPNGKYIEKDCIINDNIITITLDDELSEIGMVKVEIELKNSNQTVSTLDMYFKVIR